MTITQVFIVAVVAFAVGQLKKGRGLVLLCCSTFIIYWLQPLDANFAFIYWLPTITLILTVFTWLLVSTPEVQGWKQNLPALLIVFGIALIFDLNRYFGFPWMFTTSTPRLQWVFILFVILLIVAFLMARFREYLPLLYVLAIVGVILLFLLIKIPSALDKLIAIVYSIRGREPDGSISISWLGFSYVSFRLLHTIFDRKAGRLPSVILADYVNYVIFFPSFVAGPIDRLERFAHDLHNPRLLGNEDWIYAGKRFFAGLFKKFVIANTLSWIALNESFVKDTNSLVGLWLLLYFYSLQIYFDFSGYTDMAIGLGRVIGICLPENFASPYLKPNLTQFWNSWHMTLTQWFRNYFFNPFTRALRSSRFAFPAFIIIFVTQISTMMTIGLWHGITVNFVLWGIWHGIGLFIQNRWSNLMRGRLAIDKAPHFIHQTLKLANIFLTFNYVSLGWLFFMLPTPSLALQSMIKLLHITR